MHSVALEERHPLGETTEWTGGAGQARETRGQRVLEIGWERINVGVAISGVWVLAVIFQIVSGAGDVGFDLWAQITIKKRYNDRRMRVILIFRVGVGVRVRKTRLLNHPETLNGNWGAILWPYWNNPDTNPYGTLNSGSERHWSSQQPISHLWNR